MMNKLNLKTHSVQAMEAKEMREKLGGYNLWEPTYGELFIKKKVAKRSSGFEKVGLIDKFGNDAKNSWWR